MTGKEFAGIVLLLLIVSGICLNTETFQIPEGDGIF